MVDRAEFFRVADDILAEGREPSQRSIRERLARGGSFSELGPLFVEWALSRGHRVRPARDDLPDHLKDKLVALAAEIWADGLRNGAVAARNERNGLVVERDRLRLALAETAARADALEEMMRAMHWGDDANQGPLPAEVAVDPADAVAASAGFWDRVMEEVYELLGDRVLGARAILAELPEETNHEAGGRDGAWGPGRLSHKMRQKIKRGQLFLEPHGGAFCRRPEVA